MTTRPHNLLSLERARGVHIRYVTRMTAVAAMLVMVSVWLSTAALVPTVYMVGGELDTVRAEIRSRQGSVTDREETDGRVRSVRNLIAQLEPHATDVHITKHLTQTLEVRPSSVQITGFAYDTAPRALQIEGVAATRTELVAFSTALEGLDEVEHVVLPIKNYTRSTNISFDLTITFKEEK